eukprot:scaffold2036_cov256-Pinguiococcus_pyrenoidosus.AAC.11
MPPRPDMRLGPMERLVASLLPDVVSHVQLHARHGSTPVSDSPSSSAGNHKGRSLAAKRNQAEGGERIILFLHVVGLSRILCSSRPRGSVQVEVSSPNVGQDRQNWDGSGGSVQEALHFVSPVAEHGLRERHPTDAPFDVDAYDDRVEMVRKADDADGAGMRVRHDPDWRPTLEIPEYDLATDVGTGYVLR